MAADVILLTGSPGSGKSTTAPALARRYPRAVHLHTDDFWNSIVSGAIAPYLPGSDAQNHTVMQVIQRTAWTYAAGGFTTVVDGVIGPRMLTHFLGQDASMAGERPRLHYIVLRPSRAEAVRRAQSRTWPGALVDEEHLSALWDQFADLGALEAHVIDTTEHSPDHTLTAVQEAVSSDGFLLR